MKKRRRTRRRGRWRAVLPALGLAVWVALGTLIVGVLFGLVWAESDGPGEGRRIVVEWSEGGSRSDWARRLHERGLIESPVLFSLYLAVLRPGVRFRGGSHVLRDDLSARQLVARLARSKGRPRVRVAIPEGFTRFQIADRLDEKDVCDRGGFLRATTEVELLSELGIQADSAEGYLFPATYQFHLDSDPDVVVRRLHAELRRRLDTVSGAKGGALGRVRERRGWGEHEVLILASMVERESANPKERRTIAGVFFNRLDSEDFRPPKMLQSDPTAAYGCRMAKEAIPSCRSFDGKVTPAMIRDEANRYNTYKHAGLPPGPIANPGVGSIEAVLDPEATEFFYFVATGEGRHAFSRTFEEHSRHVERIKNR